jgi:hypothetical protein
MTHDDAFFPLSPYARAYEGKPENPSRRVIRHETGPAMTAAREAVAAWTRWRRDAGAAGRAKLAGVLGTPCPYALAPFAMAGNPGREVLLAMIDPPPATDFEALLAWQPGDVAVIDPATGRARLAGDRGGGWLVGAAGGDAVAVFSDGMAWARAWASRRADALATFRRGRVPGLFFSDPPDQGRPGLLICGHPGAVDWSALLGRRAVRFDDDEARRCAAAWMAGRLPTLKTERRAAA